MIEDFYTPFYVFILLLVILAALLASLATRDADKERLKNAILEDPNVTCSEYLKKWESVEI